VDDDDLRVIGAAIWEAADQAAAPYFTVGSSGLDYALLHGWNERHPMPPRRASPRIRAARSILAVSGSRSSVTSGQIALAVRLGYRHVRVAADDGAWESAGREAVAAISAGQSAIVDVGGQPLLPGAQAAVARRLGELTSRVVAVTGCHRLVVCGGDTSSAVARALGTVRTQFLMPISPGVPLCSVDRGGGTQLEVAFKGGQLGKPDLFERVRCAQNSQDARA
jgi:3-oxoisoapionate kinase